MTAPSEAARTHRPARAHPATRKAAGIGLMILAIGLFTVMDTLGKALTASYPVPQVVWARYFFQFALMLLLIPRVGLSGLIRTTRPGMHVARGLLLAVSTLCLIKAVSIVPLADAYTITFVAPLLVTVSRSRCSASAWAGGAGAPCSRASPGC
jgi:drug/metabolite transporter (DMT)-like permease